MNFTSPIVTRYVYLVTKTDLTNGKMAVKIGYSYQPEERVKQLQTANDTPLKLLATFPVSLTVKGALKAERKILNMFRAFKTPTKNEWVHFDPIFLMEKVMPQIQKYVDTIDVANVPTPIKAIADAKLSKAMYMTLKVRQIKLNKKTDLTLTEDIEKAIVTKALAMESNLERKLSKVGR